MNNEVNKYVIDFRNIEYYMEFHPIIKHALDFPDYYGCNWSAFWDCLTDMFNMKVHIEKIRELVDSILLPREKEIIVLRYGLKGYQPKTQREVARHLGISRSYVSRIEKHALEKMKEAFGDIIPCFDD